jgi:hypothetical protein
MRAKASGVRLAGKPGVEAKFVLYRRQ